MTGNSHSDLPRVFLKEPVNRGGCQSTKEIWTQQNMFPRAEYLKPEEPHQTFLDTVYSMSICWGLGSATGHANTIQEV